MANSTAHNLDQFSVEELTQLIEAAKAKVAERREEAKSSLVREMEGRAKALGLTLNELVGRSGGGGRKSRSDLGRKAAVKYRSPNGDEWSGRGRIPRWLAAAEASGQTREQFRASR